MLVVPYAGLGGAVPYVEERLGLPPEPRAGAPVKGMTACWAGRAGQAALLRAGQGPDPFAYLTALAERGDLGLRGR
ncbi:MAG TPA: hypothetical protein VFV66_32625 [Nonomuraea sp.]|nr:hypothetical protein [Nonomuraea sp.]